MKVSGLIFLLVIIASPSHILGQRIVNVPASGDPNNPTNLTDWIMGDTMANGARQDNNTIYRLVNGAEYTVTSRLENSAAWALQIEAINLTQTDQAQKPKITRTPDLTGVYQPVIWSTGDVTLKNLWIISGERVPGEQHNWGYCRFFGHRSRVVTKDCIIEKDRGGFLQFRADSIVAIVENCVFRNGGNRFILEGNGRAIDTRHFAVDTLIVRNTVIHNLQDRVFRSKGNVIPHNYIEFDHNTIFNVVGRHGYFMFEMAHQIKLTNNLMINPMMLGASPYYAEEQDYPDGNVAKLFSLDTLVSPSNATIANNNIFWTQDVIDVWAMHDTVSRPPIYSDSIVAAMGGDTTNGHFEEVLTLNKVPINITQYVDDLLANPAAEDMFDIIVQDSSAQGTARDFGNLFDFLGVSDGQGDFDPYYDEMNTISGSAATDGGPIGVRKNCLYTEVLTWKGSVASWTSTSEWDNNFLPNRCTDVIIPDGSVTLVNGTIGKGKTLDVQVDAVFEVELGGLLEIE